jgi:DNA-binding CsgD family transcriptional regulator
MVLRTTMFAHAVDALGTTDYSRACFRVLEQSFDVDHWALFRYRSRKVVRCVATASRAHEAAAQRNVDLFLRRCYRFDPALTAFKQRRTEQSCLIKMAVTDIDDKQYRQCFESTEVRERLSFFAADRADLLQLCIYRATRNRTFSVAEMSLFATLAQLVVATALKHEAILDAGSMGQGELDFDALEHRFLKLELGLSKREAQVCARAAAGSTIEETAHDLRIRSTSVITYRQRAYQKLSVSRRSDLLALVCNVRSNREDAVTFGPSQGQA